MMESLADGGQVDFFSTWKRMTVADHRGLLGKVKFRH